MTNEKIVIALLLIAIILSIVSVIVTFSLDSKPLNINKNPQMSDPDDTGDIQLTVQPPAGGTG